MLHCTPLLRGFCAVLMAGTLMLGVPCATAGPASAPDNAGGTDVAAVASPKADAVLLVAFGTSVPSGLSAYRAIKAEMLDALPNTPVIWAYTSEIIRTKLAKQGTPVPGVEEALESLWRSGYSNICVQSLHVAPGEEFSELERRIVRYVSLYPEHFGSVRLGRPLLESLTDLDVVTDTLLASVNERRAPDEAVLFMAHGQAHGRGDLVFSAARAALREKDSLAFLASVEGSLPFDSVLAELKAKGIKQVWLHPFMVVTDDHTLNNLLGEEPDSWASQLKAAGLIVQPVPAGMGEISGVAKVFTRHAMETTDDLSKFARSK